MPEMAVASGLEVGEGAPQLRPNRFGGRGALSGLVGVEFDVVVLGDAAALSFEPTDTLPDLVESFVGTRFGQPFGELGERVLDATMPRSLAARSSEKQQCEDGCSAAAVHHFTASVNL